MNRFAVLLLSLVLCHRANATWQATDEVIFNGVEHRIALHPLEQWKGLQGFQFYPQGSDDARGHRCTWEVRDNRLYLVGIEGAVKGKNGDWEDLTLKHLFSDQLKDGRVSAEWFSGTLYAPGRRWGERLSDAMRDEQLGKATLVLNVKEGQVSVVRYDTPMHWAAQFGHVGVIETLLSHGEDINVKDKDGWTPLHWAAERGHENVIRMLLAKGANRHAKNSQGFTPSDLATRQQHDAVFALLNQSDASGRPIKDKDSEQAGAGQPATRSESKSEGGDKPQPQSEGRSR